MQNPPHHACTPETLIPANDSVVTGLDERAVRPRGAPARSFALVAAANDRAAKFASNGATLETARANKPTGP